MLSVVAVGDAQCHGQGCRLAGVAGWVTVQSAGAMDLHLHPAQVSTLPPPPPPHTVEEQQLPLQWATLSSAPW